MTAGGLGSTVSPLMGVRGAKPPKSFDLFRLNHSKIVIVKVKIHYNVSAIVMFNLLLTLLLLNFLL